MGFVRVSQANGVGRIELDRPRALNALDDTMIADIHEALRVFAADDAVETVLVTSASERAFCAGGDIRAVREAALAGDAAAVSGYFTAEYALNHFIADYPKPYVAVLDGPTLGGGLGISVHGEIRVVTERSFLAMPETAIGFFPDIGASYFLPRLPAGVGLYLGLTGARVSAGDAVRIGLATHFVPSVAVGSFVEAVAAGTPLGDALRAHTAPLPDGDADLTVNAAKYFDGSPVPAIVGGLRGAVGDAWAEKALAAMAAGSPTSHHVTARLIELGASSLLGECLDRELATAERITMTPDFAEGVRAVLVDKDRDPTWTPADVDLVDPAVVRTIVGE